MTTARWRLIEPEPVVIANLVPSNTVDEALLDGPDTSYCGDPVPHVVVWEGRLHLSDGNHRIARARLRGQRTIFARVLRTALQQAA